MKTTEAELDNVGLKCRKCGGNLFHTTHTEKIPGQIRRTRICRQCGWRARTIERFRE